MRGITVFFTLVVVAAVLAGAAIGTYYFFRRKRNVLNPPHDSGFSSSSYNRGATWTPQTQQIHRLPPPILSYPRSSYPSPATYAHSQAAPKTPAPSDHGRAPCHARPPSQTWPSLGRTPPSSSPTQPSSTRTQTSPTRTQPSFTLTQPSSIRTQPSLTRAQLSPRIPTCGPTESKPRSLTAPTVASPCPPSDQPASARSQAAPRSPVLPGYDYGVYHSSVAAPHFRTPSQTQLSPNRTHPSTHVPSCVHSGSTPPLPTVIQVISPDLHSDEPASIEDLEFGKKLREQARRRGREMSEARSRAKSARKKRYGGGAQAHNQQAIAHEKAMKDLDKRAAKIIFREKNKVGRWVDIRRDLPNLFSTFLCPRIARMG